MCLSSSCVSRWKHDCRGGPNGSLCRSFVWSCKFFLSLPLPLVALTVSLTVHSLRDVFHIIAKRNSDNTQLGFFVLLVLALKLNRGWQENNLRHCWKLNPVNRLQDFQRRVDSLNVARQKAGVSAELRN